MIKRLSPEDCVNRIACPKCNARAGKPCRKYEGRRWDAKQKRHRMVWRELAIVHGERKEALRKRDQARRYLARQQRQADRESNELPTHYYDLTRPFEVTAVYPDGTERKRRKPLRSNAPRVRPLEV